VENRIVRDAEISPEEIDKDVRVWHLDVCGDAEFRRDGDGD